MNTTVSESPFQCDPDAAKAIVDAVSKGFLEEKTNSAAKKYGVEWGGKVLIIDY